MRVGTIVLGNTYRHPAVVAKMAAQVDIISGGRLLLGLGAGWQENEHEAYGIPFHSMRERLEIRPLRFVRRQSDPGHHVGQREDDDVRVGRRERHRDGGQGEPGPRVPRRRRAADRRAHGLVISIFSPYLSRVTS